MAYCVEEHTIESSDLKPFFQRANMYQSLLAEHELNCYDSAITESFFATLKTELIYGKHFRTRNEA